MPVALTNAVWSCNVTHSWFLTVCVRGCGWLIMQLSTKWVISWPKYLGKHQAFIRNAWNVLTFYIVRTDQWEICRSLFYPKCSGKTLSSCHFRLKIQIGVPHDFHKLKPLLPQHAWHHNNKCPRHEFMTAIMNFDLKQKSAVYKKSALGCHRPSL